MKVTRRLYPLCRYAGSDFKWKKKTQIKQLDINYTRWMCCSMNLSLKIDSFFSFFFSRFQWFSHFFLLSPVICPMGNDKWSFCIVLGDLLGCGVVNSLKFHNFPIRICYRKQTEQSDFIHCCQEMAMQKNNP